MPDRPDKGNDASSMVAFRICPGHVSGMSKAFVVLPAGSIEAIRVTAPATVVEQDKADIFVHH